MVKMARITEQSVYRLSYDIGGREYERISSKLREFITEISVNQF